MNLRRHNKGTPRTSRRHNSNAPRRCVGLSTRTRTTRDSREREPRPGRQAARVTRREGLDDTPERGVAEGERRGGDADELAGKCTFSAGEV
jgi:hypothetical protein